MKDQVQKDYGMFVLKTKPGETKFAFGPVYMGHIVRRSNGVYSTSVAVTEDGEMLFAHIDLDKRRFGQLLSRLPREVTKSVKKSLSESSGEVEVDLRTTVAIGVNARIGVPTVRDSEEVCPFIAVTVLGSPKKRGDGWGISPDLDAMTEEIFEIARTDEFLSLSAGGKFDEHRRHCRTREIGAALNEKGGKEWMLIVHERVMIDFGDVKARELEMAWGEIGEWLG